MLKPGKIIMYITANGMILAASGSTNSWTTTVGPNNFRYGTAKNDVFNSARTETIVGGGGDDTYHLWTDGSKIVEQAGGGIDTVYSRYWGGITLADHVENLYLMNKGATWANGNASNNLIVVGDAGATIDGRGGDDVLVGGKGADVFKIGAGNGSDAIVGFRPSWDVVSLSGYGIDSFEQLKGLATQAGADVSIQLSGTEKLVLRGITLDKLHAADFNLPMTVSVPSDWTSMSANQVIVASAWTVFTNPLGQGYIPGFDFKINAYFDKTNVTDGLVFTWDFPLVTNPTPTMWAYPEIIYGHSPLNTFDRNHTDTDYALPVRVGDIVSFTSNYDVKLEGNKGGTDIAYDIWLSRSPTAHSGWSDVSNEVMIWAHAGDYDGYGEVVGTTTIAGVNARIFHTGTYTAFVPDRDILKADIDVGALMTKLVELGIVSNDEYIRSVEFGAELVSGKGAMTINDFNFSVETRNEDGGTTIKTVTGTGVSSTTTPSPAALAAEAFEAMRAETQGALLDGSGAPTGHKVASVLDDGTLQVDRFDLGGTLRGREIVANKDGMVVTQRFDGKGDYLGSVNTRWETGGVVTKEEFSATDAFLGAKQEQTESNGVIQTRNYDANWTMTGGQRVTGQDTATVKTEFYDADWAYAGKDITVTRGDVVATTHYDAEDKVIGRERVVSLASEITRKVFLEADGTVVFKEYHGTTGDDIITGTPTTSHFHAGAGSDILKAGSGQDHFYFETTIGKDVDRISGFAAGKDKIHLDNDIFTALSNHGTLSADQFVRGSVAQDANDHLLFDAKSGALYYDEDGNGSQNAVLVAQLKVNGTLTANDFLLF